jgi:dipeptidyl aminopeptidase/acylaminoacyl peptidase
MDTTLLYQLKFLSDLIEGPKGKPLFIYTDVEKKPDQPPRYRSRLAKWDGELQLLTQGEAKQPYWHNDSIYFTRKVDKANQLFRLPVDAGEAQQLTFFKAGISSYKVSPQGSGIALLSQGDYENKADEAKIFETWPVKYDQKGLLGPNSGIWLWQDGNSKFLYQPPQDITEMVWDLESRGLYLVMPGSAQERWNWQQRVYYLNINGNLTELFSGVGPISGLHPTPDGGLVYLAHEWEHGAGTEAKLYYRNLEGTVRLLAEGSFLNSVNSDMRIGNGVQTPKLGAEGAVYVVVTSEGSARVMRVNLKSEQHFVTPANESVLGYAFCGGELFTLSETSTQGAVLKKSNEALFNPNAEILTSLASPKPIIHQTKTHHVPGWILLPDGDGPHPVILYIHGGPHTAFGHALMLQLQFFRANGYAVTFCNPRGSTGYGQDYVELGKRWGDIDETDLIGFLDTVLAQFPLDKKRVAVAGGSYGGYMTNWLTARHPERFKAAVTDRSICNWTSFFGASDIGPRFTRLQLGTSPWENPDILWEKSPMRLAHQVKTPTLVVHSEQDHRCPIDQGESWYTMLLQRGVPTRFFRCPEEGHELSRSGRPDRRIARLEAYLDWFKTYL